MRKFLRGILFFSLFHRLHDVYHIQRTLELLEQLHRNITIHQLHHFHLLREQQKCLLDWRREEINALEAIRQAQSKLWDLFEKHVIEAQARTAKEIFDLMDLVEQQQQDMADWSKEQIDQLGLYFQEATKEARILINEVCNGAYN